MSKRSAWVSAAALCAAGLGSGLASADNEACRQAYVETQRLQRAGRFRAARSQAVACAQVLCSETVRAQCTEWLTSIERALPTLVIDARDGAGATLAEVRVEANGELLAERLNGRAIELDPGEYVLRFSCAGQTVEQQTLIHEAEKYRAIEVRFDLPPQLRPEAGPPAGVPPPPAAAPSGLAPIPLAHRDGESNRLPPLRGAAPDPDAPRSIPTASYVLGGLGLASLTGFAILATSGYASERRLRKTCAGTCEASRVDSVRTRYLVADAVLGLGAALLGSATVVWIWEPTEAASPSAQVSLGPQIVALTGWF